MRIIIREDGKIHRIILPTSLMLSRLSGSIILKAAGKRLNSEMSLSKKQVDRLFREARRWKRKNGSWTLAEIKSSSGEEIKIII